MKLGRGAAAGHCQPLRVPSAAGLLGSEDVMFQPRLHPRFLLDRLIRQAAPLPGALAVLLRASGAAVLAATASLAWAAPGAPPGAVPAAPSPEPGRACPVPGKITAADGSLRGFAPSPRNHYLEMDGKEVPAELYHIDTTAMLVISPKLASPLLLKATTVLAVPLGMLERKADGTIDVRREAVLRPLGPFRATADAVTFSVGGHGEALRMRPPLDFLRAPEGSSPHLPR